MGGTPVGTATLHQRVGELAASVGTSVDTIRYYERVGLMPVPDRTSAGYRIYGEGGADRLRFIQGAQRLGLTLADIRELLAVRDTGVCACEPAEELIRRRVADLDAQINRLAALRAEMMSMAERIPAAGTTSDCPQPTPGTWCPPSDSGGR